MHLTFSFGSSGDALVATLMQDTSAEMFARAPLHGCPGAEKVWMLKANGKSLAADLRARPVTQQWVGSTTRPSCSHNKSEDRSQLEEGPKCCIDGMACRLAGVLV